VTANENRPAARQPPLLRRGHRDIRVRILRSQVAALGLPTGPATETDLFDDGLDHAVRAFQQQRGLTADGIVGPETTRALDAARWHLGDRILRYVPGHLVHGDDVVELQTRLTQLGVFTGRPDGVLGPETEGGLRELQRSMGLRTDGTCGPDTFRLLTQLNRTHRGGDAAALREREAVSTSGTSLVGRVVVIDPGHGGDDHGVQGNGLAEADIVLDLAARLEGRLTASGVSAVLTRGASQQPTDAERAALADAVHADVFLSLHCDGMSGPGHGVACFYWGGHRLGGHSAVGRRLAGLVQREILARTDLADCRTHPRTWDLLRLTRMPAVRVELGYLTDPGDARRLADPAFRDVCAEALLVAIQRLFLPRDGDPPTGTLRLDDVLAKVRAADAGS